MMYTVPCIAKFWCSRDTRFTFYGTLLDQDVPFKLIADDLTLDYTDGKTCNGFQRVSRVTFKAEVSGNNHPFDIVIDHSTDFIVVQCSSLRQKFPATHCYMRRLNAIITVAEDVARRLVLGTAKKDWRRAMSVIQSVTHVNLRTPDTQDAYPPAEVVKTMLDDALSVHGVGDFTHLLCEMHMCGEWELQLNNGDASICKTVGRMTLASSDLYI